MSTRTDGHRPGVIVPSHYRFLDVLDLHDTSSSRTRAAFQRASIGDRPDLSHCSICGSHLRYAVVWAYHPHGIRTGIITTGTNCASLLDPSLSGMVASIVSELRQRGAQGPLRGCAGRLSVS